ncbi:MAG: bifunctional hydroxymethylpyrimidine kinase/phosphomethylpyrimidine kinase [Prevotellaceae bacterium]|nr:bifunctional hydroxymethylpyrimidine kinase/phosphomethylpyrimidine kinase [Prevotellaceae bacterium]
MTNRLSHKPPVLTIAGSDPSGGAGMQADLRTIHALGCYGLSIITALTAQSTCGVQDMWPLCREQVATQANVLLADIKPAAVKIGMLGNASAALGVLDTLDLCESTNVVVDTILLSSSGKPLLADTDTEILFEIMRRATIITPNLPEARYLLGGSDAEPAAMAQQLSRICGGTSVLLKGGHGNGDTLVDILYHAPAEHLIYISHARVDTPNTHGTGCTLSAALASYLAFGHTLPNAAQSAVNFVHKALTDGANRTLGHGHGPTFFG